MEFINQAVTVLQTLVVALGAGLAVWGVVNLMEGYGCLLYTSSDSMKKKSARIKELQELIREGENYQRLKPCLLYTSQAEHFIRSAAENHARISGQEKGGD